MAAPKVKVWIVAVALLVAIVLSGAITWVVATSPVTELKAIKMIVVAG